MENKRFKMFIGIILIVLLLGCCGFFIYSKLGHIETTNMEEYTPQEEISDEQFRSTNVKLYFKEVSSNNLKCESRSVDAKELISNPYITLFNLLIKGPNSEELQKVIPDGTVINNAYISKDTLVLDLSEEFIKSNILRCRSWKYYYLLYC